MIDAHYPPLVAGYAVALVAWLLVSRAKWSPWPAAPAPTFERPWRETAYALLSGVGVILLGQLWVRGIHLPETGGPGPLFAAINQMLIFAPMPILLLLRRDGPVTAWLPPARLGTRFAVGLGVAALAVITYSLLRAGADTPVAIAGRIVQYWHLDEAVQVFMEDLAIAVVLVRFAAAVGRTRAVVIVAVLFAAAHVPSMLAGGTTPAELGRLAVDAALAVGILGVLMRSRDIVWFWCLHFTMDMTQFPRIVHGAS